MINRPVGPEKQEISNYLLPNYCSNIAVKYETKVDGVNKLVPNLGNKSKYVAYCRNLQLYLQLEWNWLKFKEFQV